MYRTRHGPRNILIADVTDSGVGTDRQITRVSVRPKKLSMGCQTVIGPAESRNLRRRGALLCDNFTLIDRPYFVSAST